MKQILLLVMSAGMMLGQSGEFNFHAGTSRFTSRELGPGSALDNGWLFGFRITLNQGDWLGHEFGYQYNRTGLVLSPATQGQGMGVHRSFYSALLYATGEGKRVRPFLAGGGQFANFVPPGASAARGQGDNQFGFHYGAGVKVKLTDRWLMRFDVREYNQGKPFGQFFRLSSGRLRQQEVSMGFSYTM